MVYFDAAGNRYRTEAEAKRADSIAKAKALVEQQRRDRALITKAPTVSGVRTTTPVTSEVRKAVADARPTTSKKSINKPEEDDINKPT